jgi:hypothetical protein
MGNRSDFAQSRHDQDDGQEESDDGRRAFGARMGKSAKQRC